MKEIPKNKKIVLFDGVCNFCNKSVLFIIEHDKKDVFRFAFLQSELGKKLTQERGIDTTDVDSILLIDPGTAYYVKSSAALEIARHLSGYSWMRIFLYLPESIRDFLYDIIAKNRYKWFGKKENCMIPTAELEDKFLG